MRFLVSLAFASLVSGASTLAYAWTPPAVGIPCHVSRGMPAAVNLVAGNYLGGRPLRDGYVDRKSFQACFRTIESCERWLARQAQHYPLKPGLAACTPLTLGGAGRGL
ncbi:hypothetical protein MCEMSEM23_00705 [Rhabdaerophilaceae bacterium]